ncbi:cytochrome P450 CYP12A2-like [Culicoides brevitarsis]|uniref:cytochrome P450 CYP12A2-like n=1 Tax=Culicoides brevitarsis TaxID=469753 RepID=UPI00307B292D
MLRQYLLRAPRNIGQAFATQAKRAEQQVDGEEVSWENARPYLELPGPGTKGGVDWNLMPGGKLFGKPFVEVHRYFYETYGIIVRIPSFLKKPDFVLLYDPDSFAKVLRTEGPWPVRFGLESLNYYRRNRYPQIYKDNGGLLVEDSEPWGKMRSIVNPVMMQPKVVSLYVSRIDEVTRDFVEVTRRSLDENSETPADYGDYIQRWALESIGDIALDTRLGVLEKRAGNKGDTLAKLVENFFRLSFKLDGQPHIWKYIKTPAFYQMMKTLDGMTEITLEYVEAAVKRIQDQTISKPVEQQSVLEKLLKADKQTAVIMAMDMLIVGIDTTSSQTKALLFLLAKHPEKQEKLREELRTILPTKDTLLTADKMKHLPYLRACMKESNRVIPVVVGTSRQTNQDLVLNGYQIPKGTHCAMATQLLMKDDRYYGRSAEFIPERWLKDESKAKAEGCPHAKQTHPFVYLPFGFGTRTCIGRRFAELETAIFITRLVREFDISWHYEDLKVRSTLVDTLDGSMKFRLKELPN